MRPSSSLASLMPRSSSCLGEEAQLTHFAACVLVSQPGRIVAGEAGVAILRPRGVAAALARCSVESVDRDEPEAVDADEIAHVLDRHARCEELRFLRRVDAVEA